MQDACRYFLIESGFALLVAFLINVAVISVSGTVCSADNLSGENVDHCNDLTLNSASFLLKVFNLFHNISCYNQITYDIKVNPNIKHCVISHEILVSFAHRMFWDGPAQPFMP